MRPPARHPYLLAIALALAPELAAQTHFVQARSTARDLFVVTGRLASRVHDGERLSALDLPPATRVAAVHALADGWLVAGTESGGDGSSLVLVAKVGERLWRLPLPIQSSGRFVARPVLLVERGALVGLAWLEGDRYDGHAVRAAAWDGAAWSEVETVSSSDLESQLALAGAVLSDGSWLLVWSAVDGDDDLYWSRRGVGGGWSPPRLLHAENTVPDIHPTVVTTPAAGALVAWARFDGSDYRVRLARLEGSGWRDAGFPGPPGAISPSLLEAAGGAYLLYRSVLPAMWVAAQVDAAGRPWRHAAAAVPFAAAPAVVADESGVSFRWPAPEGGEEAIVVTSPWQVERLGLGSAPAPSPTPPSVTEPGAVVYRGFGDSILRGSGDPVAPAVVFDVGDDPSDPPFPPGLPACAPEADPFAVLCGLNWRLEDHLDPHFASDVANDGVGGETTAGGVSRVELVLADGGDVLLLMEATNDIAQGTSNATILANLETMIDKATDGGFDAGIASVIRWRKLDSAGNPVADPMREQQAEDLRQAIDADLAPAVNRVHIDAWSALDPALGATDYWNGFDDCCGHPDGSGYDQLEAVFTSAILADPVLAAPAPVGPSGNVGLAPTFSWSTAGNARLYQLSVTGAGGSDTWYDAVRVPPPPPVVPPLCSGGTCAASLGPLPVGSYTWKVRGKNLRGPGPFSAELPFAVHDCSGLPADVLLDGDDNGTQTYHACPGSVTTKVGFVVSAGETVTLHGTTSVVLEGIEVEDGSMLTVRSD